MSKTRHASGRAGVMIVCLLAAVVLAALFVLLTGCASVPARNVNAYLDDTGRKGVERIVADPSVSDLDKASHVANHNALQRVANRAAGRPAETGLVPPPLPPLPGHSVPLND